ncbi:MAG: hypothetical protein R2809_14460 [Flavobacteriales bacterium]
MRDQVQPIGIYYGETTDDAGRVQYLNKNLGLNKAQHLVLGYDHRINNYLHAKLEGYYQHLYNISRK